ncbi:hypothetical protein HY28_005198, partial [Salmonella enterica subsp. enterica]|nr:hypothetical protein [Salmonella enterica subsp. enterica serovar Panama]
MNISHLSHMDSEGGITLCSSVTADRAWGVVLDNASITARNDITVNSTTTVNAYAALNLVNSSLNSTAGNITLEVSSGSSGSQGFKADSGTHSVLTAASGNVIINITEMSGSWSGAAVNGLNVTAKNINITGNGDISDYTFSGGNLSATDGINISTGGVLNLNNMALESAGNGGVSVQGGTARNSQAGLNITGGNITAAKGAVTFNGSSPKGPGVVLINAVARSEGGDITVTGSSESDTGAKMSAATMVAKGDVQFFGSNISLDNSTISGWNVIADLDNSMTGNVAWSQTGTTLNATKNITITNKATGTLAGGGLFNNSTLNAGQDIHVNLSRVYRTQWNLGGSGLSISGGNISADGSVELTGYFANGHSGSGIAINGNAVIKSVSGNITLDGSAGNTGPTGATQTPGGMNISGAQLLAVSGNVTLNGRATDKSSPGLTLNNVTMNAVEASLTGSHSGDGTGFILSNLTWLGGLKDINNISLSSKGSSALATNRLDAGAIEPDIIIALLAKGIENNTYVNKSLNDVVVNGFAVSDDGGINVVLGGADKLGVWIFDGMNITGTRDIKLQGVGFINSTLHATGNLSIENSGPTLLTKTYITADDGFVSVCSKEGNIDFAGGNISAKNDVTLNAGKGGITITGVNANPQANISSSAGDVNITAANFNLSDRAKVVFLNNVSLNAGKGVSLRSDGSTAALIAEGVNISAVDNVNISLTGLSSGYTYGVGVFKNSTLSSQKEINITSKGLEARGNVFQAAIAFLGDIDFSAKKTSIDGEHVNAGRNGAFVASGVMFSGVSPGYASTSGNLNVEGEFNVKGKSLGEGHGVIIGSSVKARDSIDITGVSDNGVGVEFTQTPDFDKALCVSMVLDSGGSVKGYSTGGTGLKSVGNNTINISVESGNVFSLSGESDSGHGVALLSSILSATESSVGGFIINGSSNKEDGVIITGNSSVKKATLKGQTDSGNGVNIAGNLTTDNATQIHGHATGQGTGVNLGASLTGASISGSSEVGNGLQLANNAVVTEAVLNGSSTSGDGVAVTGKVTLDDTSAAALNASSTSGTGLKLADNANVSIQTVTRVTQE